MVSIYKRGSRLYLQYPIAPGSGKRLQRSTGLEDTPANRKLLKQKVIPALEAKIVSGKLLEEMERKRVRKDLSHYARIYLRSKERLKTYRELSRQVDRVLSDLPESVEEISRGTVREWAMSLVEEMSPKTARRYINVLGAILDSAIDYEAIRINPALRIKLPSHTEKPRNPFSSEEIARLLELSDGWFRNYLAIAFYTGARPGEILALRPEDVNLKNRTLRIERNIRHGRVTTPKTKYSIRTVPIFDPLLPYLRGQMMQAGEWLFTSPRGGHYNGARKLGYHWELLMERSGMEYRELYTTRHSFITHMLMAGHLSILEIAQIVGHKNATQIMQSYARFIADHHLKISRNIDPFADTSADTDIKAAK